MYEVIGMIATVFVLLSFLFNEPAKIRAVNALGAATFVAYGILIGATSVWVLNAALIVIQLYHLFKLAKKESEETTMGKNQHSKAVVLLSGGVDSTTCLAMAINEYGKENVETLNILYGQKHGKEKLSAVAVAKYYGVPYHELDMSVVMEYSDCPLLKHSSQSIKHKSYGQQLAEMGGEGTVDTYVPFRNGLFLSAAASFALSVNADKVYYGAHADDAAGRAYPDCTPEFAQSMDNAIYEGSGKKVHLVAPLINFNKAEVVREGLKLNAPYQLTWSCYEGGDEPCGECGTCIDRQKAFEANGVEDPAKGVKLNG